MFFNDLLNILDKLNSKSAQRSGLILDLIEMYKETELEINEVSGETLKEIILYLEHYKESEPQKIYKPINTEKQLSDVTDKWDVDFIERNKDLEKIKNLIIASEYLRITPLHELVCCHVACILKDLEIDEIQKKFGITEDITEEEMKKMEEESILEQKREKEEELKKRKEEEELLINEKK